MARSSGELKELPDISEITVIGSRPRRSPSISIRRPFRRGLDPLTVQARARRARAAGDFVGDNRATHWKLAIRDRSTPSKRGPERAGRRPVHLGDVALVTDDRGEPVDYVMHHPKRPGVSGGTWPIAKRKGTNDRADASCQPKVDTARGYLLPRDLNISVTRDYGETAAQKSGTSCCGTCFSPSCQCRR
jgi:hypothetical protein